MSARKDEIMDLSRWPLVRFTMPSDSDIIGAHRFFIEGLQEILAKKEKFSVIFDIRDAPMPDGRIRRYIVNGFRENEEELNMYMVGLGMLCSNIIQKSIADTIKVFIDLPFEYRPFLDEQEAEDWLKGLLG